ncbi:hypothetical protein K239x_06910 [Planctomycetes bacterium K23_9]|uniref:Uncharacterized protein n=1 Tax=Stieleria marina TaxID=1930275 RepID=A0A517NNP0_9BACT|nr:hypothetical protein K239x_06910 [Planctomycetes bacterium K23_9]
MPSPGVGQVRDDRKDHSGVQAIADVATQPQNVCNRNFARADLEVFAKAASSIGQGGCVGRFLIKHVKEFNR